MALVINFPIASQHYANRYERFINSMKGQLLGGYTEKHHIIPRKFGGPDSKDNLVVLTPRQHYIAHWILWKAYQGPMARAFFHMSTQTKYEKKVSSRLYAKLREQFVRMQMGHGASLETRRKISEGQKNNPRTKEQKELMVMRMKETKKLNPTGFGVWINDGQNNKKIKHEQMQEMLNAGWVRGLYIKDRKSHSAKLKAASTTGWEKRRSLYGPNGRPTQEAS